MVHGCEELLRTVQGALLPHAMEKKEEIWSVSLSYPPNPEVTMQKQLSTLAEHKADQRRELTTKLRFFTFVANVCSLALLPATPPTPRLPIF